jgi:hypothetical protein
MRITLTIVVIIVLIGGVFYYGGIFNNSSVIPATPAAFDGKNITFVINGMSVTLINGIANASKIITRYFGNEATGDLDGDSLTDTAFLVTQEAGGSGTFYYVVVALKTVDGYKTTNAFFVGDRIAPQLMEIHADSKELYVNYTERKQGESMSVRPSVGATLALKVAPAGILEGLMR